MVSSLFISYCRREAPFVDSFLRALEKRGFEVWLDYHVLIPGRPWQEQIYEGLKEAEVVLLVVSQESIASKNVKWEWEQAIALNKRIILIIFEAVKLPPELEQYEWIDLRGRFREGIKDLTQQLETPISPKSAPPQSGFKAPSMVGLAIGVSAIVSLLSLLTVWTVYIPYYLLPLPYRIVKRDFNFFHVRNALFMLPFALFWTIAIAIGWTETGNPDGILGNLLFAGVLLVIPFAPLLALLLYSPSMQRWGKPIASRPKFANLYRPNIQHPRSTCFTVDFAKEDQTYAEAIIHCLKRYGHQYVEKDTPETQQAEAVLVLISAYKNTTTFNPEEQAVYPVLLQDTEGVDPTLKRIQWIDFRRGLKNLNKLAQLLPEPTRLLKALGIVPLSGQTVLPPIVEVILCYLTVLALMKIGGWSIMLLKIGQEFSLNDFLLISFFLGIGLKIIISTTQALINRKGFLASVPGLVGVLVVLGWILHTPMNYVAEFISTFSDESGEGGAGTAAYLAFILTYWVGLFLIVPLGVWHFRALRRWFPPMKLKLNFWNFRHR